MDKDKLKKVETEIARMSNAIRELERMQSSQSPCYDSSQYTAAVRRASMDLTRALSRLRNS